MIKGDYLKIPGEGPQEINNTLGASYLY